MNRLIVGIALFTLYTTSLYASGDLYLSNDTKLGLFFSSEFDEFEPEVVKSFEINYKLMIEKFREKQTQSKSDLQFMKYVFYTVHRKMLGEYEQYVTFSEIFSKQKKYDCVTGTALYALILDDLGIDYEIHETDYHVYLIARSQGNEYLFESTDALGGLSWNPSEIAERRDFVNQESVRINSELAMTGLASDDTTEQEATYMDNVVNLSQLAGLHFYNQALKNFNAGNFHQAFKMIIIAQGIYPSSRIKMASSFMFAEAFED